MKMCAEVTTSRLYTEKSITGEDDEFWREVLNQSIWRTIVTIAPNRSVLRMGCGSQLFMAPLEAILYAY